MKDALVLEDDQECFACGMKNLEGLRIAWKVEGHSMTGEFVSEKKYQGWKGLLHGGIIATLLDEAMARLAGIAYRGALTAEMTVRYVIPARIGETLFIRGEIVSESRRLVETKASVTNREGKIVAYATGKAVKV